MAVTGMLILPVIFFPAPADEPHPTHPSIVILPSGDSITKDEPHPTRPIVILPLGDSITDGGIKLRSYRYHLVNGWSARVSRLIGQVP